MYLAIWFTPSLQDSTKLISCSPVKAALGCVRASDPIKPRSSIGHGYSTPCSVDEYTRGNGD